ncbi:hypothetical protein SAMN05880501_102155 [Ureibacillus xyleni]|uniref:Uncharacterized protein n=1 Tax=Ureibacillus xyleni TaxID=614648 RepID=A0A285RYK6_9BACL|nr:hypothetical protein SAMN05880501_102155 [Ureibacillus xyleni]
MSIKNAQYAFLESDYNNPNLNKTDKVLEKSTPLINTIPPNVLLKCNWILIWLISIPVDIYCITIFVLANYL